MSDTPEQRAERIIRVEGLTFAMACLPPQKELAEARKYLMAAIVREIKAAEMVAALHAKSAQPSGAEVERG